MSDAEPVDWSREESERLLGCDVVAALSRSVAEFAPLSAQRMADIKRKLAPHVQRVLAGDAQAA